MVGDLARSAPRSERDPDLEAAKATLAMHLVTGASADSIDELSAFAVMFFRTAYPFDASILSSPPGGSEGGGESDRTGPPASLGAVSRADNVLADVAVAQPRVIAHRAQEAVDSRPRVGGEQPRQEPHLPVGLPVASCVQLKPGFERPGKYRTLRQQALHVARQRMQSSHTDAQIYKVAHTLSLALGSSRTEAGTIKAVHTVLLHLDRTGMSEKEAYTATGASMSNFKKWRRRAQHAQLDLPGPPP